MYSGGSSSGAIGVDGQTFFQFSIGEAEVLPIEIESIEVGDGEVTLTWAAESGVTYGVFSITDAPPFTLFNGLDDIATNTVTFPVDLVADPKRLFQIREVVPN